MEFMMIRSVKSAAAGTSGGDLSKPTLGLISGGTSGSSSSSSSASNHHNNLYQHHHAATASPFTQASSLHSHSSQQQQQQQYQQPQQHSSSSSATLTTHSNSYGGIKFSNQARAPTQNSTGDYNSWKRTLFSSQSTSQNLDAFGSSQGLKKKSPMMVMPILIKNKDTLDRISSSNCVQNSNSGFFGGSSATSVNSSASALGVYSGQQRQAKSTLNVNSNSFGVALCSNRFQTDSPKKMNKLLWETSHQKVSAEAANGFPADVPSTQMTGEGDAGSRKRKQPQTFEVNSIFSSSSSSKKQKLEKKSSLHMPNLLKWLSNGGKSGDAKQRNKSSDNSLVRSINSFKSPCTSLVPVRTGIPIENVFLKKYDPIKLLKRLRCSTSGKTTTAAIVKSVVTPKRKKLVTINNFPSDGNPRAHRAHKSTVTTRGRKKKRKRNTPAQSNALTWTPTQGALQVSRNLRKNKKAPIRLPKHCKPKRKVNVKYRSHGGNSFYGPHSEDRLRVIAAVYLKRALARLRTGGKVKTSVIRRRLRKLKEWRRMHKAVHNNSTLGGALVKTGNSACQRSGPLTKFFVTNSNLPSPMPIETYSYSLVEHPYQMHTLQLLRHKRELQDRLETIEADGTVQKVGSLPEKPEDGNKVPFLYDNMLLKKRQVKHVISQKLLICLSTVGFTHTKLRPLEVMADATSNFMTKLAQRLRAVSEMEMYGVDHGFPDAMERVLSENGLGGIRGLEEFYRTKVNDYGHRMEDQCLLLRRQYAYKVRSKVGMMSNVNTSSTSSISAASSSSSSSVTTISAPSSTITSNNISSTVPHAPPSLMVVSGGGGTSIAATGAVASKSVLMAKTSSSSSQPLSPGNRTFIIQNDKPLPLVLDSFVWHVVPATTTTPATTNKPTKKRR